MTQFCVDYKLQNMEELLGQVLVNTIKKIFFQHKHHVLRVQQVTTVQIKELPSSVHQDSSVTKEMGRVLPVLLGISVALQVTNYF